MATPRTEYAITADGLSIAYQRMGSDGPNLVWITGTASHIELFWEIPGWARTMRRLASFSRFVWFDKRGTGLSDRSIDASSLEARMEDIRAVLDAAGMDRAVLVGSSESAAMAVLFAATFPERVERLVVLAGWAFDPEGAERSAILAGLMESSWGTGVVLEALWARGVTDFDLLGRIERAMGTPTSMAAVARVNGTIDVRPALSLVQAPTLVLHCTGDPVVPVRRAEEMAALIPGAVFVEVPGDFHASGRPADMDLYGDAIEEFVAGSVGAVQTPERVLSTVLFTDIVGSTAMAGSIGDHRWSELLDEHDRICRAPSTTQEAAS